MVIGNPLGNPCRVFAAMGGGRRLVAQSVRIGNARIVGCVDEDVIAGRRTLNVPCPKAH
jgi:hypothetical protein